MAKSDTVPQLGYKHPHIFSSSSTTTTTTTTTNDNSDKKTSHLAKI